VTGFLAFLVCVMGAAVNVAFYADQANPVNLGAAILCGFMALLSLTMLARS
jgi:hypothetical protein